jgi:hypothetical protein
LLDALVRHAEDGEVHTVARYLGDRGVTGEAQDLVVSGVHRVDRALVAAAAELLDHRPAERAFLDRGAHDGDRSRLEHRLESRPRAHHVIGVGHYFFGAMALSFTAAR